MAIGMEKRRGGWSLTYMRENVNKEKNRGAYSNPSKALCSKKGRRNRNSF